MQFEVKLGHDAKVTAATTQPPKQVAVFCFTGEDLTPVRSHHVSTDQTIDGHTILAAQPAESAAQG